MNRGHGQQHGVKHVNREDANGDGWSEDGTEGVFTVVFHAQLSVESQDWIVDNGATSHIMHDHSSLLNYTGFENLQLVSVADGYKCQTVSVSQIVLHCHVNSTKTVKFMLTNVLFVPNVSTNFFSL